MDCSKFVILELSLAVTLCEALSAVRAGGATCMLHVIGVDVLSLIHIQCVS